MVACAGPTPPWAGADPAALEAHCRWLKERLDDYRGSYLPKVERFFAAHRPKTLPAAAVYPFGGGDLLSALATYPEAAEYTTLSLELAGDPRRIRDLDAARSKASLLELERRMAGLFAYAESTSENLMQMQRGDLPGQLSFFLVALAAHGYEPVGLRYFRLEASGALHYLTEAEISAEEPHRARSLSSVWKSPDFAEAFRNSELTFRLAGRADAPLKVHRHLAANLSDDALKAQPAVLLHLRAKGRVAAMTKAASYLLWAEGFSLLRHYLVENMDFMISDSSGLPPSFAAAAGFEMETYGRFEGPYLTAKKSVAEEYKKLWAAQPARPLDFRYGYPDASKSNHLVLTRRSAQAPGSSRAPGPFAGSR